MSKANWFLFLSCWLFTTARAQLLQPTKTDAVVVITVTRPDGIPLAMERMTFENVKSKTLSRGTTDARGIAEVLLPAGNEYLVHFDKARNFGKFTIPKEKYYTLRLALQYDGKPIIADHSVSVSADTVFYRGDSLQNLKATASEVLLRCHLSNYSNQPLDSEWVSLHGIRSGKYFKGITGKSGDVQMLVPKGDMYQLDFVYEKNVDQLNYPLEAGFRTADISYQYLGSRELKKRFAAESLRLKKASDEQIAASKKEFEEWSKQVDFFAAQPKTKADSGRYGNPGPDSPDSVLMRAAKGYADPVVLRVLTRHSDWNVPVVVADLTGSMSPYTEQLALWFREQLRYHSKLDLVFFNDGDGKPDDQKKIGSAGGIHPCLQCNMSKLDTAIRNTVMKGTGGDGPENNIEVLIKTISLIKPSEPIVMIADNRAPVRDLELLPAVKKPVRIILCGADSIAVHPDYLLIAKATGGTVSTSAGDSPDLSRLKESEEVLVCGHRYVYSRNRFHLLR